MNENSIKTPFSNRGVVNTQKGDFFPEVREKSHFDENLKICVDWCEFTIFNYDKNVYDFMNDFFGISYDLIVFEVKGMYGYDVTYSYKNIKVLCSTKNSEQLGMHILLSGSACRDIEDLHISFISLFTRIFKFNSHFTRIDIAVDNFSKDYFSMDRVKYCIKNNLVVSRFRNTIEFIKTHIESGTNKGYTIWFGSRASNLQFVFYDKLKERESQNVIVSENIKNWCRLEVRFRNEYATEVARNLITKDFNIYVIGIIKNYIKFVEPCNDSNKSRFPVVDWWNDFINDFQSIKLYTSNYTSTITRKKDWLLNSTSRSNVMVLLSSVDNLDVDVVSCNFLIEYINKGLIDISLADLNFINSYRIERGLQPLNLEDFKYLVGDIKDILLEKNKK